MLIYPVDPQRPPDWRWQNATLAEKIIKGSGEVNLLHSWMASDPNLRVAFAARQGMLKEMNRSKRVRGSGRTLLSLLFPGDVQLVINAEAFVSKNTVQSDYWLYKSLVLGRAPIQIMAQLLEENPEFIVVLNSVFFDVEQRLFDTTFVWNKVIGTDPKKGLLDNVEALWEECGYLGGFDRLLYLRAKGIRKERFCSIRAMQEVMPTMGDYLNPAKVSKDVMNVIEKRMSPDSNRTIEDLRQLYLTLPGKSPLKPGYVDPVVYRKNSIISSTFFEIVNLHSGLRQRREAEVLDDSNL